MNKKSNYSIMTDLFAWLAFYLWLLCGFAAGNVLGCYQEFNMVECFHEYAWPTLKRKGNQTFRWAHHWYLTTLQPVFTSHGTKVSSFVAEKIKQLQVA
jgi:hypothetical protein